MSARFTAHLLLLALVVLAATVPAAHAGTYEVVACDTSVAGGANNSFAPHADAGMAAYSDCRPSGEGMVARNVYDNGTTPSGNRAAMIFDAPPGTSIQGFRFDGALERHTCTYSTILAAGGQDFGGEAIWGYGAGTQCGYPTAENSTAFNFPGQRLDLAASRLRLEAQCVSAGCGRNGRAAVRVRNARVVIRDDSLPVMSDARGGLLAGAGWMGGEQSVGLTGTDNTGIREFRVSVDGRPVVNQALACDVTQRAPCPARAGLDRAVSTTTLGGDGRHRIRVTSVDAAGNESNLDRDVDIDNTAPDAPENLVVAGGDGWRSANVFDVTWKNPSQPNAPISGAEYELCRASGEDCVVRSYEGGDVSRIASLQVPAAGEWRLKLWLRDAAGNRDRRLIAPPVTLRFDDTSPEPRLQRLLPRIRRSSSSTPRTPARASLVAPLSFAEPGLKSGVRSRSASMATASSPTSGCATGPTTSGQASPIRPVTNAPRRRGPTGPPLRSPCRSA